MARGTGTDSSIGSIAKGRISPFVSYFQFAHLIFRPRTLAQRVYNGDVSLGQSLTTYLTAITIFGIVGWAYGTEPVVSSNPTVEEILYGSDLVATPILGSYVYAIARFVLFVLIFWPVHILRLQQWDAPVSFSNSITIYFVYCAACAPLDALFIFTREEGLKATIAIIFLLLLFLLMSALSSLYDRSRLNVAFSTVFIICLWVFAFGALIAVIENNAY